MTQQQGLLRQLTRYPNPSAGWVQSASSRRSEGETQGAFISQDIVTAGKLRIAGQAERAEIEWRTLQLKAQTARVLNDVRIRYYEVLGAQQAMDTAAELERLAAEDLKTVGRLLEAKQASRPDVLQAEIHLGAVRASHQDARLRHQAAWRQLANLVGVPHLPPAPLPGDIEDDLPQFDWDESLRRLLAESPVLRARRPRSGRPSWRSSSSAAWWSRISTSRRSSSATTSGSSIRSAPWSRRRSPSGTATGATSSTPRRRSACSSRNTSGCNWPWPTSWRPPSSSIRAPGTRSSISGRSCP